MAVVLGVGLPSVDEPGLYFQLIGWKPLNAHAVEKPRRVRRHIGRLVSPVIEIIVTEQADIRHEDSCVDIESVIDVEVVPAIRLGNVLVSATEVPLANPEAGVIARCCSGKQPLHEQDSAAYVLPVEVTADAGLLDLDFAGTERFSRPDDGVISRLVEIFHVVRIKSNFRGEEFSI